MFEYRKLRKSLIINSFLIACMFFISIPPRNFYRIFENKKNITIHIRENNKDILVIKEKRNDKFYYSNLQQYLIFEGVRNIEKVYTDKKDIKELLPKININETYEYKVFQ